MMQNDYITVIKQKEEFILTKLFHVLSDNRKNNVRVSMAHKDAEISALKVKVSELYVRNDELGRENRKLSIRNSELTVAYNSLKEILRKRGVCTP